MRVVTVLLCLALAACAGTTGLDTDPPATPAAPVAATEPAAADAAAKSRTLLESDLRNDGQDAIIRGALK